MIGFPAQSLFEIFLVFNKVLSGGCYLFYYSNFTLKHFLLNTHKAINRLGISYRSPSPAGGAQRPSGPGKAS